MKTIIGWPVMAAKCDLAHSVKAETLNAEQGDGADNFNRESGLPSSTDSWKEGNSSLQGSQGRAINDPAQIGMVTGSNGSGVC